MKRLYSFLILLSPVLFALSANAQVLKKAPEYRLTTKWKLVIKVGAGGENLMSTLQVEVLRDTFAFGSACWKIEAYYGDLNETGIRVSLFFLVRKSDANTIACKQREENWERIEFNVLQFPMKVGAVYQASIKADGEYGSFISHAGEQMLCKVSSRGDWEHAPLLSNGSKPATWILNCMVSPDVDYSRFLFPLYFIEPDESAGFPGSCPVQVFFDTFFGIANGGHGYFDDQSIELVSWEW